MFDPQNAAADTSALWSASSVIEVPAETFSPSVSALLLAPHTIAIVLLVVGLVLSFRRKSRKAMGAYMAGIAVGLLGFGAVLVAKSHLEPAGTATYAYAYTGERLTSVVYDGSGGITDEETTDGRIVECNGLRLADGRMLILAKFDNGQVKQMMVAEQDIVGLMAMLMKGNAAAKAGPNI